MSGRSHIHHPKVDQHEGHHDHAHGGMTPHEHHHRHAHPYRPEERRRLGICMVLTGLMMLGETVGGLWSNSLALLSDAGHMLTHFFALAVSYLAIRFAARPPTKSATYGYYRIEVLSALLNAVTLVIICAWICYAAIGRLRHPQEVQSVQMVVVAVVGLIVNLATAMILHGASREDRNIKGAYLHMLGDTLSSVAVILGGIAMTMWNTYIIDPLLSILLCVIILLWAYGLTRDAIRVLMEATPEHITVDVVAETLQQAIPEIAAVNDLHLWEITNRMYALTAHVHVGNISVAETMRIRQTAEQLLDERFDITHAILQFEC